MAKIEVLAGVSVPYVQDETTKKWSSTKVHTWNLDNPHVNIFAKEADLKIKRRSKNHGKISYPFKARSLASLLTNHLNSSGNITFSQFVEQMQVNNSIELKTSRVKSKVVLILLKYKKTIEYGESREPDIFTSIVVVMLKDKSALRFGDDGAPLGTEIIDFDDVMQAAMLDVDEFCSSVINKSDVDVSFINGIGGTTNYFIEFFDAEGVIRNKESVTNVIKAFENFSQHFALKRPLRELCEEKIKAHIDFNERKGFATKLNDISSLIYNALRGQTDIDFKADSFNEYVQEYNYKVNEEFTMSKSDRESFEFISFDTDVGALKLKKSLFGDSKKNVTFNELSNELTIVTKIKDPEVIAEIKKIQK